jgi:hypothetical protein
MATAMLSAVLSPESQQTVTSVEGPASHSGHGFSTLARRLDSFNGKTVYLVDTGFGGSSQFLDQVQAWFAENMSSVKTIRRRKPGNIFRDDSKDLWNEIKDKGQAAILGVAG